MKTPSTELTEIYARLDSTLPSGCRLHRLLTQSQCRELVKERPELEAAMRKRPVLPAAQPATERKIR